MTEPAPDTDPPAGFVVMSPEQLLAALTGHDQAVEEAAVPSRLIYADEVTEGMVVDGGRGCVLPGHTHRAWCSVLRIRTEGHVVSAVLVDEHGEQLPAVWHDLSTVRVRA